MKITPNWPSIFRYSSCLSPGKWRWTSSTGQTLWKPFNFKLKDRVSTKLNIDQGTNFTTLRDTTASLVHFHRLTSRSSWSTKCWVKWLTWVKKKSWLKNLLRCIYPQVLVSTSSALSWNKAVEEEVDQGRFSRAVLSDKANLCFGNLASIYSDSPPWCPSRCWGSPCLELACQRLDSGNSPMIENMKILSFFSLPGWQKLT